jgi:hypothetical protein
MKSKHYLLLLLVPFSEIKALFYNSDVKVYVSFFSNKKSYLCNVIEDYINIIIFSILFYFVTFIKIDRTTRKICFFLFILTILDLIHLGIMDMQYFIALKIFIAYFIYRLCFKYATFLTA